MLKSTTIEEMEGGIASTMTLKFTSKPTNEELRKAVVEAGLHSYRFVSCSADGLEYEVEKVKVSLSRNLIPPGSETWTVPVELWCDNCRHTFEGWKVLSKKYYDNRTYRYTTYYCPRCLPIDEEVWLCRALGFQTEKPTEVTKERAVDVALNNLLNNMRRVPRARISPEEARELAKELEENL